MIASVRPCPPVPPSNLHGKEGVDGSSPSEGFAKAPQILAFSLVRTCTISSVRWVWSPSWSPQVQNARWKRPKVDAFAGKIVGCACPTWANWLLTSSGLSPASAAGSESPRLIGASRLRPAPRYLFERPLLGRLVRSLGAFPARGGDEPGGAVATAARLARWGEPVVIFPAGARLCKDPRAAAAYRRDARRDPGRRSRPYLDRSADPQPSRSPLARVPRIDSRSAGAGPTRSGRGASQGPPPHRRASCIGRARAL